MPTPAEVQALIHEARNSRRPEHAEVIYLAATTGARRGEICALRRSHLDTDEMALTIERNIVKKGGQKIDKPTKNRRRRVIALDHRSVEILRERDEIAVQRAADFDLQLVGDPYLFAVDLMAAEPWDPDTITQYFGRIRSRLQLDHLEFKSLRSFMDTYGQELGFSTAQVAIRAGHDPAVAGRHYTGKVATADRSLAEAMSKLLA